MRTRPSGPGDQCLDLDLDQHVGRGRTRDADERAHGRLRPPSHCDGGADRREPGVAPRRLRATVDRFNGFAHAGRDADFHRGQSVYDRYYGDPTPPNPNLAPLEKGPYYAIPVHPGDIGTKGGLVTDATARVLREDGTPIDGLYASGNVSSAVMGETYPGPGATIGPAMTFGWLAAGHIARTRSAGAR
ncbi:FAD-binding protein [Streptomyces sp. NPDC093089]|uniref:FAD-binding protein n=1 Tax=Streptomyces sp. NPDC093089 TaxID=3366024 RepID=UPI003817782F